MVVMGLGRFGGGIGVTRWLVGQGAEVTVTDSAPEADLVDSIRRLDGLPVRFRLGGHDERDLDGCALLVVSPAVPKDRSDFVRAARARGVAISSEMNLFLQQCPARRVIGITGSAGKSTTTAMTGAVLTEAAAAGLLPRVWVGGNIGQSLLGELGGMGPDHVVVLELSSFQLEDMGSLEWSPPFAVITNIRPNHLDRHGTLDAYAEAKLNIVRFQKPDGLVFIHDRDEDVLRRVSEVGAGPRIRAIRFVPDFSEFLQVPGEHNRLNAAVAIAVARALGVPDDLIARGLRSFGGLPHRLEFVAEVRGVRYYNDSKSTTPESSLIALNAFDRPVIMLIGGRGKGMPFEPITRPLAGTARGVICYGEEGGKILQEVKGFAGPGDSPLLRLADSFEAAVQQAADMANPGDVVVLSPACVSYDMFRNYEHRGDAFRRLVHALPR